MNCQEVQEQLSAYHDGELADDMRSRVSDHLGQCSDCAKQLAAFENLSELAGSLSTLTPPAHIWSQLENELDQSSTPRREEQDRRWSLPSTRPLALAATVLIAVGIGWLSYQMWFAHGDHDHFTEEFGHYLEEFQRDPDAAQQFLIARYEGQVLDPERAKQQVGYRPAVLDGLPEGYEIGSTYIMEMPCCKCVQTICKRADGSSLVIFEHDDEETKEWFGDRPETMADCNGKLCSLVELDDHIAASWKRGNRHITLIGVRDTAEVDRLVAWMDGRKLPPLNRSAGSPPF